MAAKAPAFQFYANDFKIDTDAMSLAARGGYISMLASSWTLGAIADNPKAITTAMGWGPTDGAWEVIWNEIKPLWELGAAGWTNRRLEATRDEQAEYRKKQSEKGLKGGRPKAELKPDESRTQSQTKAEVKPEAKPEESPSPLTFDLDLRSSSSLGVQTEVQRDKPALSAFDTRFEEMRQHLKAAAYAHIAEFPECEDGELADAVKDAAAKLKIYDYTGRKITSVVNDVRGYLAKVSA